MKKKRIRRFKGFATDDGYFFLAPPTGTFANNPRIFRAELIVEIVEGEDEEERD